MSNSKQKEIFILILCLLLGFALRFYTFDQKSLWIDEIHTFNDSRDGLDGQIKFYRENPTYLHPPLFFVLTHLFYPFAKPERDLRIIPLIFGVFSIPMIYLLSRSFSPKIALPCTLSLAFMAYHVYLSQDGRCYSMLMFLGMAGLYCLLKYLKTLKKKYLFLVATFFSISFYTSYSAILFIILSQILLFYRMDENDKKPGFTSFLILNGLTLLICSSWILFVALNYKGQPVMDPLHIEDPGPFASIVYWIFNDWLPHTLLMIVSLILLVLFPLFSKNKTNALVLIAILFLPVGGLYLFCKLFNISHFFASRYFINFLPLFFISLYLSLTAIEIKLQRLRRFMRLRLLFVTFLIASNLVIFPFYYRAEKQDLRGLVTYLKGQLRDGDKIFVAVKAYLPGILHYFGVYPEGRHQVIRFSKDSEKGIEYRVLVDQKKIFTIYNSPTCCAQYLADRGRIWIVVEKWTAKKFKKDSPCVLKGYFDGSFANFRKFPTDASMYLFLWDPKSPGEKGIDITIE